MTLAASLGLFFALAGQAEGQTLILPAPKRWDALAWPVRPAILPPLSGPLSPRPLLPPQAPAQQTASPTADPPDIADNSFLVEEAYNQEYGVVQHISSFTRDWNTGDWLYSFTQEWPFNPAPRSQLSYTIPVRSESMGGHAGGLGDILLNYRFQVLGDAESRVAFAPRFSLILPTGDWRRGRGSGDPGYQVNLPLSWEIHGRLVTHWNAGATFFPSARDEAGFRAATYGFNVGQSFIWKFTHRFHGMLETVLDSAESVIGPDSTERDNTLIVNPGFRWAYNFANGLQIVPGVSFPVLTTGSSRGSSGILLYLSFEHPFGKARKAGK